MYVFGIPLGKLVDSAGARVGALLGAVLLGAGYLGLYFCMKDHQSSATVVLIPPSLHPWRRIFASGPTMFLCCIYWRRRVRCIPRSYENR